LENLSTSPGVETAAVIDTNNPMSRRGFYNLDPTRKGFGYGVDGAMTRFVRVPARCLHHIPDHLSFEQACLTEPCCVAFNAIVENSRLKPGDRVMVIGPGTITKTVIHTDGSTSLAEGSNQLYYLDNSSGVGPELQYGGADVVAGEFGGWVPIGAVQTTGGYEVAWSLPSANQYSIWTTDSNGNFSFTTPFTPGASQAFYRLQLQ